MYHTFSGVTTEGYCQYRDELEDYISQTGIDTVLGKFNAADHLLEGTPKQNWTLIRKEYDPDEPTEENFVEALEKLGLTFCDVRARRQQKHRNALCVVLVVLIR